MSIQENDTYSVNLDLYEQLVVTNPKVQRKDKTIPYTSLNGHMSSTAE